MQAEQGAAVEYQVEFDIASAPIGLEVAFAFAVGHVHAALNNGQVAFQKGISHSAGHCKALLKTQLGKIIEKHTAYTAGFFAVLQIKILVAPFLELGMVVRTEGIQRIFAALVEMLRVFFKAVVGGQIHAATIPGICFCPYGC